MVASQKAYDTFSEARLVSQKKAPYFRSVLYGLVAVEAEGLGTIGVTHTGVLLWDPAFAESCTADELAFVLIHECMHVVLHHHGRCVSANKDHQLFNIAGDLSINPSVKAMGCTPPKGVERAGIFPKDFGLAEGLTAEEYYEHLRKMADKAKKQGSQVPQAGSGFCGSCAGQKLPDPHENEDGSNGEGKDKTEGRTEAQMGRMRREVAEAIREQASKSQGSVPSELQRWADTLLKPPRVPWQKRLAKIVRDCVAYRPGAVDFKYSRPSRRQAGLGYGPGRPTLPGLVQPVPRVAVVLDTSGSMGTNELSEGMRELNGILKATGADVEFCACDAAVHALQKVRSWRDAARLLKGGGGSSFVPAFDAMRRRRQRPQIAVFVTDGMIDVPPVAPAGMTVIWLLVGPYRQKPCNWGTCIELSPEDMREDMEAA